MVEKILLNIQKKY